MHTMCRALQFLILLPVFAQAQEPPMLPAIGHPYFGPAYFETTQDSADFMQFRNGLQPVDPARPADTTTFQYRLVWIVNERGGVAVVSRGDGSLIQIEGSSIIGYFMHLPFRMVDGRRGFMVIHETPCALICRGTVYYVEDR